MWNVDVLYRIGDLGGWVEGWDQLVLVEMMSTRSSLAGKGLRVLWLQPHLQPPDQKRGRSLMGKKGSGMTGTEGIGTEVIGVIEVTEASVGKETGLREWTEWIESVPGSGIVTGETEITTGIETGRGGGNEETEIARGTEIMSGTMIGIETILNESISGSGREIGET